MGKLHALLLACLLLPGCSSSPKTWDTAAIQYIPPTGSIVLRVEVLEVEFTDLFPGCGDIPDCVPFHFWYKYRARVKDVVVGKWAEPEVEFTHLQHAEYIRQVTRDCYVVLHPAAPEIQSKVGVPLVADRLLSRFWEPDRVVIKALGDGT